MSHFAFCPPHELSLKIYLLFRDTRLVIMKNPSLVVRLVSALIRTIGMGPIGWQALIFRDVSEVNNGLTAHALYCRLILDIKLKIFREIAIYCLTSNFRFMVQHQMIQCGWISQHTPLYLTYKQVLHIGWTQTLTLTQLMRFMIGLEGCKWQSLDLMAFHHSETTDQLHRGTQFG